MRRRIATWVFGAGSSLVVLAAGLSAMAQEPTPAASPSDAATKPQQKTICVPQIVMEKRVVQCTEYRPEWRECPVTIVNYVPETTWVEKEICVNNPERRTTVICERICRPIIEQQEITYCASEPVHCIQKCTRTVCKPMPQKVTRMVCVDEGHWVEKPCCKSDCDKCKLQCGPPHVEKEWCPKLVNKEVCVNVWKPTWIEECYDKTITTMKCATRTSTVNVVTCWQSECRQREITCTVCVPTVVVRQVPCITYKCEEIPYTQRYCVMVAHTVEKEIEVPVCRTVKMTVPVKSLETQSQEHQVASK